MNWNEHVGRQKERQTEWQTFRQRDRHRERHTEIQRDDSLKQKDINKIKFARKSWRQTFRPTDEADYRVACTRIKIKQEKLLIAWQSEILNYCTSL